MQASSEEDMTDWIAVLRTSKLKAIKEKYRMVK